MVTVTRENSTNGKQQLIIVLHYTRVMMQDITVVNAMF